MKNETVLNHIKNLDNFYYLPNQGNLGDCVIAAATYKLLDDNNFEYKIFEKNFNKPFSLVYGGGGLWVKNYRNDYQRILDIFKSENLKKCIILPSSFNDCPDLLDILDERFVVFVREQKSFEYLKNYGVKSEIYLADDMVINANIRELQKDVKNKYFVSKNIFENLKIYRKFYRKIDKQIKNALKRYDSYRVGYFLRNDVEKTIENKPYNNFDLSNCKSADWANKKLTFAVAKMFVDIINKFNVIVTDRLHISICAANLDKKVLLIDNSYGKNSAVYNYSLKNRENVKLVKYEDLEKEI